jgi:hypothetical protein
MGTATGAASASVTRSVRERVAPLNGALIS